jgi:acyl-CoA synthetase (AMP-forming)/AMP-acid ligase II
VYGVRIGQIYGATEFGSVSFNNPVDPDLEPESAGRPFKGVQFRILDVDAPDLERPLPAGAEGQVAVSAPSMFSSYVEDAQPATERGYFMTGDLGRVDETGRLWLTGRLGLLVDVGGLKVNLLEVERVLAGHPDVREVVAVPVAYSDTAQRVKAIVIPEPDRRPTADAIREWARRHLAAYKVPRSVEIREDVPRSPTGKILRQELD